MGIENQPPQTLKDIHAVIHHKVREIWQLLVSNTRSRHVLGTALSILFHVVVIGFYFLLASLEQAEILEIREITFVDESFNPPKPRPSETPPPEQEERQTDTPTYSAAENSKPDAVTPEAFAIGERLDMTRQQAPINLSKNSPIAPAKSNSDILSVSPALGKQTDSKVVHASAPINLGRNDSLQPAPHSAQPSLELNKPGKRNIVMAKRDMPIQARSSDQASTSLKRPDRQPAATSSDPKTTSTVITGQLADREIVHKVVPEFPLWARKQGVGASVALSFAVMENGRVKENVIVVQTSGASQWDDAVIETLKKWRFAPLDTNGGRRDQTGVIVFQFVIE